jgi:hypothetical protein
LAASFSGPKQGIPIFLRSFAIPLSSGSSGPHKTSCGLLFWHHFITDALSLMSKSDEKKKKLI